MTALLLLGTVYTVAGGMLSVLITDFLQFIVMSAGLIAVTVLILVNIGWSTLSHGRGRPLWRRWFQSRGGTPISAGRT